MFKYKNRIQKSIRRQEKVLEEKKRLCFPEIALAPGFLCFLQGPNVCLCRELVRINKSRDGNRFNQVSVQDNPSPQRPVQLYLQMVVAPGPLV